MDKKTIVVNDIAASPGGGLTVLNEFYDAIKRQGEDYNWVLLLSKAYVEETSNIKVRLLPKVKKHLNRILFDTIYGWKEINSYKPSVVFSLQNTVVYHTKGKKITYVHQSLPFQNIKDFSLLSKEEFGLACIQHLLGRQIKKSIKASDLSIVQTKWMKKAVEEKCGVRNVKQIYPNIPNIPNKASYSTTNTFFYPTGNVSYKNNRLLIESAKRMLKERVGGSVVLTTDPLEKVDNINYIGRISIEEVYDYYKESCLVFPSYIETFGYPLVEAKSVGSIILASDCAFSHELLDDYNNAYFFDPFNEDSLFELMRKVAVGEIKRNTNKTLCNENMDAFEKEDNWDKVVQIIMKSALEN